MNNDTLKENTLASDGKLFPKGTKIDDLIRYEAALATKGKVTVVLDAPIIVNGKTLGVGETVTATHETFAAGQKQYSRETSRTAIEQTLGVDQITLLSSASDVAAILLAHVAMILNDLQKVNSFAEMQEVVAKHSALMQSGLALQAPYQINGEDKALKDFMTRMKTVKETLEQQQK